MVVFLSACGGKKTTIIYNPRGTTPAPSPPPDSQSPPSPPTDSDSVGVLSDYAAVGSYGVRVVASEDVSSVPSGIRAEIFCWNLLTGDAVQPGSYGVTWKLYEGSDFRFLRDLADRLDGNHYVLFEGSTGGTYTIVARITIYGRSTRVAVTRNLG